VDDFSGDKIIIDGKHYIFHEGNKVSIQTEDGSSTLTSYAYIRASENESILSVADGLLVEMKFLDYDYGRITNGGSGYFEYHSSYATKGWLWYDDLPWIFSSNQGDWIYQYLFINDSNETELMYQFKTSGIITKSGELDYIGESNLSKMDAFYWDDYDDFSGSDLNSSKWDVAWWDGGTSPTLDQNYDRVVFNKGESYAGRLSDHMVSVNPEAESKYGRDLGSNTDYAPNSIAGLLIVVHEKEIRPNGTIDDYGEEEYLFSDANLTRFDWDENKDIVEKYDYQKTGPNTAVIQIFEVNSTSSYEAELTFISPSSATGSWNEKEGDQNYLGTLTYELIYEPHSLLEIIDSQNVYGVEFEVMIPQSSPDEVCMGLFAMDYNKMFNATSEDEELGATKFELDLCLFSTLNMEFYYYDPITYEEKKADPISVPFGEYQRVGFMIQGDKIIFFHEDNIIDQYPYQKGNETYVFRAMNEQNLDFSAYIKNVKVLRKKAYPKGWMWMDYYPWAYSAETGNWLYFQLAKDVDGLPGMIFWDESTNAWDLYQP